MYPVIIDANVWIRFARSRNIEPLISRFVQYDFLPVINNYLLSEVFDAVIENHWMRAAQAGKLIDFVRKISILQTEKAVFAISPDAKDNYLFDLAIQNNCVSSSVMTQNC